MCLPPCASLPQLASAARRDGTRAWVSGGAGRALAVASCVNRARRIKRPWPSILWRPGCRTPPATLLSYPLWGRRGASHTRPTAAAHLPPTLQIINALSCRALEQAVHPGLSEVVFKSGKVLPNRILNLHQPRLSLRKLICQHLRGVSARCQRCQSRRGARLSFLVDSVPASHTRLPGQCAQDGQPTSV